MNLYLPDIIPIRLYMHPNLADCELNIGVYINHFSILGEGSRGMGNE